MEADGLKRVVRIWTLDGGFQVDILFISFIVVCILIVLLRRFYPFLSVQLSVIGTAFFGRDSSDRRSASEVVLYVTTRHGASDGKDRSLTKHIGVGSSD